MLSEEEKKYIDIFISKCEKYDESVEVKGVSVGEESRILDTVVKYLKLIEKQKAEIKKLTQQRNKIAFDISDKEDLVQELKAEIEKQNKVIDKMAGNVFLMNGDRGCTKQEIIEYFTKLVEEENND